VDAAVIIHKMMTNDDPVVYPVDYADRSGVFHPRVPGTYKISAGDLQVGGVTFRPYLEQNISRAWVYEWVPIASNGWFEVVEGRICHVRVVFKRITN
jgi:hypothetical protein